MLYSPVIRSQSFNKHIPWVCKLSQCFSGCFPPPLGGKRWLGISFLPHGRVELTGIGYFPFPTSVRLYSAG